MRGAWEVGFPTLMSTERQLPPCMHAFTLPLCGLIPSLVTLLTFSLRNGQRHTWRSVTVLETCLYD